jgi:hypothetical protein
MGCRDSQSREQWREWKREQKAEWRARKEQWRAERGGWWPPAPGWTPFNIAAMVIGFILFWPVGLAILFWNIWSAKQERRAFAGANSAAMGMNWQGNWQGAPWSQTSRDLSRHSGNAVFEDYKRATLERLEEERRKLVAEQEAFSQFLDDLKRAKDRTEFETFMREREMKQEQADADRSKGVDEAKAG